MVYLAVATDELVVMVLLETVDVARDKVKWQHVANKQNMTNVFGNILPVAGCLGGDADRSAVLNSCLWFETTGSLFEGGR